MFFLLMKNITDFKKATLKEFDNLVERLSNGHPIVDIDPIVRKMILIDFLSTEEIQDNIKYSIIESELENDIFKK